jgi:hypothetical protein
MWAFVSADSDASTQSRTGSSRKRWPQLKQIKMRHRLVMILIALNCLYTFGQYKLDKIVPDLKRSDYIITKDTKQINFSFADSVSKVIGLNVFGQSNYQKIYSDERLFFPYTISFSKYKLDLSSNTSFTYNNLDYNFSSKDTVYAFGFTCNYIPSRVGYAAQNISKFYLSAYMQDIDKDYKLNHSFVKLPSKDIDRFWRRNWISMGYGMSYSLKDNPFSSAGAVYVGMGYFFDALTTFMIVGGPFIGKTTKDKIEFPILGIALNLLGKKYFVGRMSELNIESYNNIVNSKYGIPNDMKY